MNFSRWESWIVATWSKYLPRCYFMSCYSLCGLSYSSWASQMAPGGKEPTCQCRRRKKCRFDPQVRKIPWRRAWQPTPVFLPGESHGQRSLVGCDPQVRNSWTQLKPLSMQNLFILDFWFQVWHILLFLLWPWLLVSNSIPHSKPYHTCSIGILCLFTQQVFIKHLLCENYSKTMAYTEMNKNNTTKQRQKLWKYYIDRTHIWSFFNLGNLSAYPTNKCIGQKEQI